jgi:hypothetical protein
MLGVFAEFERGVRHAGVLNAELTTPVSGDSLARPRAHAIDGKGFFLIGG